MLTFALIKQIVPGGNETLGSTVVKSRGFFPEAYWYWIGVGALVGFTVVFNFCYSLALAYLNREFPSEYFPFHVSAKRIKE